MPLRFSLLLLTMLLSAPPPAVMPARASGADPDRARVPPAPRSVRFVFTGTVAQPGGRPVAGARVALEGAPGVAATADADGRYALTHVVPDVMAAADATLRLELRASHKGWNLALPSGAASLAVELRRAAGEGNGARIEVRSNDAAVAKAVARSLEAEGGEVVALDESFTRLVGREDRSAPELAALAVATLPGPPEPRPAAPAPGGAVPAVSPVRPESMRLFPSAPEPVTSPPAPGAAPIAAPEPRVTVPAPPPRTDPSRPALPDTALRPGIRVSVRPGTDAAAPADAAAPRDAGPLRVALGRAVPDLHPPVAAGEDCGCRVSGTVEVRSDRPVRGRPRVVVSLAGLPACRDTVTIFMGPPRPFDLGRVPCGRHELEVRPLATRRLARVEPDSTGFACVPGGARQFRVVLEPR
jgi:hypothetical protein